MNKTSEMESYEQTGERERDKETDMNRRLLGNIHLL